MNSVGDGRYNIVYTENLFEDLRELYLNVAFISMSEETAYAFINRIWERIEVLSYFPNAYPEVEWNSNKGNGGTVRKLVIERKYIAYFYVDNEMNVVVIGLFYGGMSMDAVIERIRRYLFGV
ncbi:MAG: hypothetical protein LUD50_03940 [Clostridia bacterium]|nr:hypothetical protein [Clostridia bacterium]